MSPQLQFALLSCTLLGLRHGFDYDHLAAITDITSIERGWRTSMRLGLLYALGHALTVALLGGAVIFLHLSLPVGMDLIGERLVGATLIVLAIYVLISLIRHRQSEHHGIRVSQSRIALLISGAQHVGWFLRRIRNPNAPKPAAFSFKYDRSSVFVVGIIHGLGAETPSQLLLFLLAANLGGTSRGFLGLLCFVIGLLMMNTLMTAFASGAFTASIHYPHIQDIISSIVAAYSFIIGVTFLLGASSKLPPLVH